MTSTSTIAALATAPTPAGIGVIRISGPKTGKLLASIFSAKKDPVSNPRLMIFGRVIKSDGEEVLDSGLAVFMPGPNSFTGEDVAEVQFHGSPLIAERILSVLYAAGAEPAEPGEFSKRAFLNGKLDLAQAEAIHDLIKATSDEALRLANEQLEGRFSSTLEELGEPLRDTLAELEASIDFPEEDIDPETTAEISAHLSTASKKIHQLLATYRYGHIAREGFCVLLSGRPNVGKSSLLNALLGKKRAIVTDVSGTTRDLIEESVTLDDYQFVFCDTAGLTETKDQVEKIGVELAKERIHWADLVLFVVDAGDKDVDWIADLTEIHDSGKPVWLIVNKIDSHPDAVGRMYCDSSLCERNFYLSVIKGDGLNGLKEALKEKVSSQLLDSGDSSTIITNARHRSCLEKAGEALERAADAANKSMPLEIIAAEIRIGLTNLEEIVGKTYTEDILGRIFSKFCIGK